MQWNASTAPCGQPQRSDAGNHRFRARRFNAKPIAQNPAALHHQIVVVLHDSTPPSFDQGGQVFDGRRD